MEFNKLAMTDLPTPSQSLLAVIRYCSDEQADADKLASMIQIDPLLSAELLKIANSAYFSLGGNITSIHRVALLLGLKAVRSLALCFAVKGLGEKITIRGFNDRLFWEDAIRRAAISSVLGAVMELDRDECFTAGLLQDIGLLVLFSQDKGHGDFVEKYRSYNPDFRKLLEREEFLETHDSVAAFLSSQWCLPSVLVDAICHHHDKSGNVPALSDILYCTDWLNTLFIRGMSDESCGHCHRLLAERLQMPEAMIKEVFQRMPGEIAGMAEALGESIEPEPLDYDKVIQEAASRIADHNLELQEMTARLTQTIQERDRLAEELNRDISIAQEVQQALLPATDSELPVYAFNVPAKYLSGDFYDYIRLADGRLSFCLGDVSGKGVNASLLMVKASTLFRSWCDTLDDQAELATKLNSEICRIAVRGMFISMVVGVYDPQSGNVVLVNAGHLPVLVIDSVGKAMAYPPQSPPFGILPEATFVTESLHINNKSLYLYTDGITETHIAENRMLEVDGLSALLIKLNGLAAEQRLQGIQHHFQDIRENLHDDTTLMLLQG